MAETIERIDLRNFPPVEPVPVPERLSQTLLRHNDKCPRSAYLYVKYRGGKGSHELDRGTAYHIFRERMLDALLEEGENTMPPELGLEVMEEVLDDSSLNLIVPEHEKDDLRGMAWNTCDYGWIDPEAIVAVERMFELEIAGWPVVGKVDLAQKIGDVLDIEDSKTRFGMAQQAEIDKGFQGNLYLTVGAFGKLEGEALAIGRGFNRFRFAEVYPRSVFKAEGCLSYRETIVDRDYLTNKRRSLEGAIATLEQRFSTWDFPARDGAHCAICPARWECPIPERARAVEGRIETVEDAIAHAKKWWWAKKTIEDEWKGVKAWGEEHGALRFGVDQILEWKPVEETKRRSGVSWADIEDGIRRAAEFGEPFQLDAYFKDNSYVRYTLRTLTKDELAAEAAAANG